MSLALIRKPRLMNLGIIDRPFRFTGLTKLCEKYDERDAYFLEYLV